MNNQSTEGGTTILQAPKAKVPVVRVVVVCLVILITLAAVAIGIPWVRYRYNNIVLREAAVRGAVTKIGSRIDGRIKSVEVQPGQRVSKGEVLLRMEDSHLQAALKRARGDLQSASSALLKRNGGSRLKSSGPRREPKKRPGSWEDKRAISQNWKSNMTASPRW